MNGSGKTTFLRLLTGEFLPTEGEVTHNKESTKDLDEKILYKKTSQVNQFFNRYSLSLGENITFQAELRYHKDEIFHLLKIDEFSLDEEMTKEFGGRELSGGEWQRIAILRGFNKKSDLILLDEPTSAIDPLNEKEIYDFFEVNSFVLKYTDLHASTIFSNISFLNKLPGLTESKFNRKKYIFKFSSQVSANLYFFDSYFPEEIKYKIYTPEFFSLCLFNDYYLMVTDFNNIKEQLSFWTGLLKVKLNIDLYPTYIKILFDKYCGNTQHNLPDFSVTNNYLVNLVNFRKNDKNIADLICKDYGYIILPEHINDGIDMRKELRDSVISIFTDYHYDTIKDILTNDNHVEHNQDLEIKPTKKKRL